MLQEVGLESVEEIYRREIPDHLRFKRRLAIPGPIPSELGLRRHIEGLLAQNRTCRDNVSFLGGGCWQHYVPAVCNTIGQRDEFLTAYVGEAFADHGKFQAQFEFASCMAELLDMEMVNTPTYDWGMAAATTIRMASRITGRGEAVIAGPVSPDRLACMRNYAASIVPTFRHVPTDPETGEIDLAELARVVTDANGAYSFTGLAEGHYRVYEVAQAGWTRTSPTNAEGMHNLVISNGQPCWTGQDYGNTGGPASGPDVLCAVAAACGAAGFRPLHANSNRPSRLAIDNAAVRPSL
jgi:glycine cleavage system pyridoxal-binding protein P